MSEEQKIDPGHSGTRRVLRTLGPILLVIGGLLIVVGIGSFFLSMGRAMSTFGPTGGPKYFWCAFVGAPVAFVGLVMTMYGYMGAVARYSAGEMAPVGKDTFNYLAKGTSGGVKTLARSVGEGFSSGMAAGPAGGEGRTIVRCHKCNADNDADAKFCDNCGAALAKSRACPNCGELNDPDAKFCDNCGSKIR